MRLINRFEIENKTFSFSKNSDENTSFDHLLKWVTKEDDNNIMESTNSDRFRGSEELQCNLMKII